MHPYQRILAAYIAFVGFHGRMPVWIGFRPALYVFDDKIGQCADVVRAIIQRLDIEVAFAASLHKHVPELPKTPRVLGCCSKFVATAFTTITEKNDAINSDGSRWGSGQG